MGCVDSKEKRFEHPQHYNKQQHFQQQQRHRGAVVQQQQRSQQQSAAAQQKYAGHRQHQHQHPQHQQQYQHPQQYPHHYQQHQVPSRRQSGSSYSGSNNGSMKDVRQNNTLRKEYYQHDRDKEKKVVTDPRGGRRNRETPQSFHHQSGPHPEDEPSRFGQRNQFDRASQLRRSKKRKKSRENSILESSKTSEKSPPRTSAKDIVIEETVKSLKTSLGQADDSSKSDYHTKYGNLI